MQIVPKHFSHVARVHEEDLCKGGMRVATMTKDLKLRNV